MTSEVTQADRKAIDRAEAFAKSKHTTPDEHDDIMVAVRLARLTAQSGEGDNPHRILKNALFALEKLKAPAMIYGGVLTEGGKHAWLEYSLREQGDYSVFSGEGRSGAGEDALYRNKILASMIVELLNMVPRVRSKAGDVIVRRARRAIEGLPDAVAQGEANYQAYRLALRDENKPDGTLASLVTVATMLDEYGIKELPANEQGQVDFMRAIMESAVDEIRAFLANQSAALNARQSGEGEPIALLHEHKEDGEVEVELYRHGAGCLTDADKDAGWTETPLFALRATDDAGGE